MVDIIAQEAFQAMSKMFSGIQFRRGGRQEDQAMSLFLSRLDQIGFPMKRSVVHHNNGIGRQRGKELLRKTLFKQRMVHGPAVFQWHHDLTPHLGGGYPCALKLPVTNFIENLLSSGCVAIVAVYYS